VSVSHDGVIQPRDELQAQVVERLRAAGGAPVRFAELRAMGIENPALLGYELAAAGLPIEQVRERGSRALVLDPLADCQVATPLSEEKPQPADFHEGSVPRSLRRRVRRLSPRSVSALRRGRARAVASAAIVVALAALLAIALGGQPAKQPRLSADHPPRSLAPTHAARNERHASRASSARASAVASTTPAARGGVQPSVAVSPAAAASLEAAGHQLLSQGRYAQAIGELREAVQASGGSVARCAQPTSEACLTFAYALYDLGSALRLDGDPHAAVPILSERLQLDNQHAAVEEQLDLARAGVV
jgi:tetratricopeptide (TPR) repeat protein